MRMVQTFKQFLTEAEAFIGKYDMAYFGGDEETPHHLRYFTSKADLIQKVKAGDKPGAQYRVVPLAGSLRFNVLPCFDIQSWEIEGLVNHEWRPAGDAYVYHLAQNANMLSDEHIVQLILKYAAMDLNNTQFRAGPFGNDEVLHIIHDDLQMLTAVLMAAGRNSPIIRQLDRAAGKSRRAE